MRMAETICKKKKKKMLRMQIVIRFPFQLHSLKKKNFIKFNFAIMKIKLTNSRFFIPSKLFYSHVTINLEYIILKNL